MAVGSEEEFGLLDLYGVYVQPSIHRVGRRRRYDTIDRALKKMDLRRSLEAIAQLAIRCERGDPRLHLRVAQELDAGLADQYAAAIERETESKLLLISPQAIQRLAVRALVHCSDGHGEKRIP